MKKILSLCLAALMIFSVLPAAFAAEEVETIANIEETSEYAEAIKFLNTLDVYTGKENGDLAADEPVERWQMANFLYRVATGDVDHSDVKTTTNYTPFKGIDIGDFDGSCAENLGAISWAYQAKVVNGYSATEYGPTDVIIYQDAITMIVRLLGERYTAASYPYGFVTTARELGILDGITGIGLEDEISRGVVAQLLYNAIFAPVYNEATEKYETLAAKTFGVEKDIVLITASNKVYYEVGGSTVLRTNAVAFKTLNSQGEPVSTTPYHADMGEFGLESATEANEAVGTAYAVYHTNNFSDILSARSLSQVYWNKGTDSVEVAASFASSGNYQYVTIAGSKYQIVDSYATLKNNQGWNKDSAGNDEVKLYVAHGKDVINATYNTSGYVLGNDNRIYYLDAETGTFSLYAYWSSAIEKWYTVEADGSWKILEDTGALVGNRVTVNTKAFDQITGEPKVNYLTYHSAYAKFVATDASDDGYIDRITMKQYSFGYIDFDSKKKDSTTAEPVFSIKGANTESNTELGKSIVINNTMSQWRTNDPGKTGYDQGYYWARSNDYRWTGIDKANLKDGYVLYYIDNENKEIDVLEVISGAKESETDDTYLVTGYIRQMNIAANTIVMDNGETYTIGYDTLADSPLKSKDYRNVNSDNTYKGTNYNLKNNVEILQPMVNTYKTLVVVDNKVVYIAGASADANFVILDEFVSFDEDGIVAKAYTTVTDEYTQIKIGAYNGWNVGGFDYYLYFLSGLLGKGDYSTMLPFSLNEVYQVVSVKDGVYNLTNAAPLTKTLLAVNEYGYITGTDGNNKFGNTKYKAVADNDYWLILDKDADNDRTTNDPKVYAYTGKLNPVILADVNVYKAKSNDYVLVAGDDTDLDSIDGLFGGSVSFMLYNKNVAQYYNAGWLNTAEGYVYQLYMTNVLTGGMEVVTIDPELMGFNWTNNEWFGLEKAAKYLDEGKIYKVIEGVLYADNKPDAAGNATVTPVTWDTVVAYYAKAAGYVDGGKLSMAGVKDTTSNNVHTPVYEAHEAFELEVAKKIADKLYPNWEAMDIAKRTEFLKKLDDGVTLFGQSASTSVSNGIVYLSKDAKWLNDSFNLQDITKMYDVYYIIAEDGTATAWAVKTNNFAVAKAKKVSVTAYSMGTVTDGVFSGTNAWTGNICDTMSYYKDETTEYFYSKITFNPENKLSFASKAAFDAAMASIKVDVVFADGTKATYTKANEGNVPDGITVEMPPVFDGLSGDASSFMIVNFEFDLQDHGFVKSYTVTIDKGPGAAVQLTVVNPYL